MAESVLSVMSLRRLIRDRYFTLPAVLSIAASLAACCFVFGLVRGVLLTPLPYDEAERLVLLRSRNVQLGETTPFVSAADFIDWRRSAQSFDAMALFHWAQIDLWGVEAQPTERVQGLAVTPAFFAVMGLSPAVGRWPESNRHADPESIVLGRHIWDRRFGSDPAVVGETIAVGSWRSLPRVGPMRYRVEAVAARSTRFLPMARGLGRDPIGVDDRVDFWVPLPLDPAVVPPREHRDVYGAVGRLKEGVTPEQARAELEAVAARLAERYPDSNASWTVELVPLSDAVLGAARPGLWLLFAGAVLLLLISCSNVGSLELARLVGRRRELAIRSALGASRFWLAGQVVLETLAVAASAGVLGLGLAAIAMRLFRALALPPAQMPRVESIGLDTHVLVFTIVLVAMAGLMAGCGPAWHLMRDDRLSGLRSGSQSASPESQRLLRVLAIGAVGLAFVLLVGAGLVHQSLSRLLGVDPGYDRENLLTLTVSLPEAKYPWRRNTEFLHEVVERSSSLPGVLAAGAVRGLPGREAAIEAPVILPGRTPSRLSSRARARIRLVNRTYFEVMRIPLVAGRLFEPRDERGETGYTKVALINETMARRLWPGDDAVGQTFHAPRTDLPPIEVIGIVGDVRYGGLEHPPGMEMYYPESLFPQAQADLILRTETEAAHPALSAQVQAEIRALEPDVLISQVASLEDVLRRGVADRRMASWLLSGFSSTALFLAAVGAGGVMAHGTNQRRRELGLRVALGARPHSIVTMVLGQACVLAAAGSGLGLLGASGSTRLLSQFLYGVEPMDPTTFAAAALVTVTAVVLASLLPALRASSADPLRQLHHD